MRHGPLPIFFSNSVQMELGCKGALGMEDGIRPRDMTETKGLMCPWDHHRAQCQPLQTLGSATCYETLGRLLNLSLGFFIHKIEITTARLNEIDAQMEPAEPGCIHVLSSTTFQNWGFSPKRHSALMIWLSSAVWRLLYVLITLLCVFYVPKSTEPCNPCTHSVGSLFTL